MSKILSVVSSRCQVINKWIKQNRGEFIALLLILLLGAFLRLYKISQYMTFLGDEGRDMIIVRRLLVSHNLVFVGPGTSVGNMYLGPFYYYLIAPFLFLWNFSPVGPSVEVALFGVATVFLVWYISKDWFADNRASFGVLTATFLYAISPVVIVYSRSSWNPNIMPFFALTTLYGIWQVWFNKKWKWLVVAALGFAVVIQSHYLGLILIPLITFFWILSFISSYTDVNQRKKALLYSFLALGSVFALMSPLVVFDAKYDWRNFYAMRNFFAGSDGNISLGFLEIVKKIPTLSFQVITRLLAGKDVFYGKLVSLILSLGFVWLLIFKREKYQKRKVGGYFLLLCWLGISLLGLSFYSQPIYDHYLGFLFPAPYILLAGLLTDLQVSFKKTSWLLVTLVLIVIAIPNIKNTPISSAPGRQLQTTIKVSKKIVEESVGAKFNLAVISEQNYEGAYQYFLEKWNTPLSLIDPQRYGQTKTDQLFVVCEYQDKSKCQPTSNPKAEVANFGWSKIDKYWSIDGIYLYRLVANNNR